MSAESAVKLEICYLIMYRTLEEDKWCPIGVYSTKEKAFKHAYDAVGEDLTEQTYNSEIFQKINNTTELNKFIQDHDGDDDDVHQVEWKIAEIENFMD